MCPFPEWTCHKEKLPVADVIKLPLRPWHSEQKKLECLSLTSLFQPSMLLQVRKEPTKVEQITIPWLGNCDIHAVQKLSITNVTKQNEIQSRPKGWVWKTFWTFLANFGKSRNKSCWKFWPFYMAWKQVSKTQQIFNEIFNSFQLNLAKIFGYFTGLNKK